MASILGSALGAFANNSIDPIYYNDKVNSNLNFLGKQFKGDNAKYQSALDAFNLANSKATADYDRLRPQTEADYNSLLQTSKNFDPMATYENIRSGNLSALKDWSGYLEGQGQKSDNLAMAALGMGGRPNSSYSNILSADRVSRNIAPVLGNIFSSLGNDTSTIGNQFAQGLSNSSNLINARNQTPLLGYGMQLDPANALMALRRDQTSLLGDQTGVARNNTAGFQQKTDTLGKVANSMNAVNDAVWQNVGNALSVYSSLYGGGMLGGGGGGGLGGMMGGGGGGGGISVGSAPVGSNSFNLGSGYSTPPAGTGSSINAQGYPVMTAPGSYNPWASYGY